MHNILLIISLLITLGAQGYITSTYSKFSKVKSHSEKKGCEIARIILDNNGLNNIEVEEVSGHLSDHYDPKAKKVRLSSHNYHNSSISAISVAAHECGHAIQDKENYHFMRIRASLVPVVNFSTKAAYIAMILGFILGSLNLIWLGIFAEIVILAFQLITLPVEFDASKRALKEVEKYTILNQEEVKNGKKVLTSAALTYVASVAAAILEILRLVLIFGNRRD